MNVIILGATSGLGRGTAELFAEAGHKVGIAGRRIDRLLETAAKYPNQVVFKVIDVIEDNFTLKIEQLIEQLGTVDLFLYSSGVGKENFNVDYDIEKWTNDVNINGFTKAICFMYDFFSKQGYGHLATISSIAGYRGIGGSSAYSASKSYQRVYFEAIANGTKKLKRSIKFTTIIPGFVDTEIIAGRNYPLTISCAKASKLIYKGLLKKQRYIYVDGKWWFISILMKLIPRCIWERLSLK